MRNKGERIKMFCPQCRKNGSWGATSWFVLVGKFYTCAGDPAEKREGCGKKIEKDS